MFVSEGMRETEVEQTNHCNVYNGWRHNKCITFVFAADTGVRDISHSLLESVCVTKRRAAVEVWVRDPR